jgi:amino acid permease
MLVPSTPTLQAALAHLLAQKYRLTRHDIPYIRLALELESEGVRQAFQRQYHRPLDMIYSKRANPLEWVGWQWNKLSAWLEHLPPFWTAYALTFTQIVGASILALPIAMAGVGPLAGLLILVVVGLINILTIAAMAEAVTRNGSMRYQGSYLGRLVQDYLGRTGSTLLTAMVVLHCALALIALYFGFSLTLAGATPVQPEIWAGVLFLLGLYFVRRNTLQATVTSALVVGAISMGLILILCGLALVHLRPAYLLSIHVPFLNGAPFQPALLGLIFGVVFSAYFGHFSVSSCARTVLQRDPGGRSLLWGCIAAQASAMLLYMLWIVAINGAIAPQTLAGLSGTVLVPLANLIGPAASVCGALLAILAMGMATIHISLALNSTVRELIPGRTRTALVLARRQGSLIFTPHGAADVRLALTYLGLIDAQPHVRLDLQREGETRRLQIPITASWEATSLLAELVPDLPSRSRYLALQLVRADADTVRVQCTTTMHIAYEGAWDALGFNLRPVDGPAETDQTDFIKWLAGRERANMEEVHHFLQTEPHPQAVVKSLVQQGILLEVTEQGQSWYQVHFAARRRRAVPLILADPLDASSPAAARERDAVQRMKRWMWLRQIKALALRETTRSWLSLSPLLLLFLLIEWLLANKLDSFPQLLSFRGAVTVAVVGGAFPILLLVASRRKGENVPGLILSFLTNPLLAGGIYLLAIGSLFLHGLLIWQDSFQRGVALLVGVVVLITTCLIVRQGAFTRRLVIEVRQDAAEDGMYTVTDSGRAATQARVKLVYAGRERLYQGVSGAIQDFPALSSATFHVSGTSAQELKVWLHRVTPQGHSEQLPALVKVSWGEATREFHLDSARDQLVFPLQEIMTHAHEESREKASQLAIEVQLTAHSTEATYPGGSVGSSPSERGKDGMRCEERERW